MTELQIITFCANLTDGQSDKILHASCTPKDAGKIERELILQ